jgi:hypothetical protein
MGAAVATALAAAVAFGWSTALMHHSASSAPAGVAGIAGLLRHLVVQWRWLLGMAASLAGLGLHALALRLGSLALVQPLVVSGLVFSFLFRAMLDRELPSGHVMRWVAVTAAGLALLLIAAGATSGVAAVDRTGASIVLVLGAAAAIGCFAAARRAAADRVGLLLGASAGVVFGVIAGTLKAAAEAAGEGALLNSWPVYVLIPLGVSGFLLNQQAYHRAPLAQSLPVLNTLNPLVALTFGVAAFNERPPEQLLALFGEGIGLLAVLAGVFFLARQERLPAPAT